MRLPSACVPLDRSAANTVAKALESKFGHEAIQATGHQVLLVVAQNNAARALEKPAEIPILLSRYGGVRQGDSGRRSTSGAGAQKSCLGLVAHGMTVAWKIMCAGLIWHIYHCPDL